MATPDSTATAVRFWSLIVILLILGWYLAANHSGDAKAPEMPATPSTAVTGTSVGGHR